MSDLFTSIRRTPYQSFASFLILFFTLFLSMILFVSLCFLYGSLRYIETRPQLTVYFQAKADEKVITKLRDDIQASGKVLSIKYINKAEAFNIYKQLNKDNPLLLEMVSSEILPASLEIKAKDPTMLPEIADYAKKQPGVDSVDFQKNIVDRLLSLTNVIRKVAITLFFYLILMTIVVLTTMTMFKIALKKDEIELLQLIGAGKFYIRRPFLMEALFFGFMASVVSFIFVVSFLVYIHPFINSYFGGGTFSQLLVGSSWYSLVVWPLNGTFLSITFILAALFGMTISFVGSYLATKKYLT